MDPENKKPDPFDDPWLDNSGETLPDEMPEPGQGRPDFIKPHHVGKQTQGKMKLLGVSSQTSEYSDVILRVEFKGKEYALGLKLFSADYKALKVRFGNKRADWTGELRYRVMRYKDSEGYVSVR